MVVLRVLQLSDTHVVGGLAEPGSLASAVELTSGRTTNAAFEAVLDRVDEAGLTPGLVLHTGDVVDVADEQSYLAASKLLGRVNAPALVVSGNHDDPKMLSQILGEGRIHRGEGWLIVLLDSHVATLQSGALGKDTLVWLDELLSDADGHVLIGLHHPPLSVCGDPECGLRDAGELLDVIDRHPNVRGVLSGHLHWADEIERREVRYLLAPSTCVQLRHIHPLADHNKAPTPVGARIVDLHADGTISSELVWARTTVAGLAIR